MSQAWNMTKMPNGGRLGFLKTLQGDSRGLLVCYSWHFSEHILKVSACYYFVPGITLMLLDYLCNRRLRGQQEQELCTVRFTRSEPHRVVCNKHIWSTIVMNQSCLTEDLCKPIVYHCNSVSGSERVKLSVSMTDDTQWCLVYFVVKIPPLGYRLIVPGLPNFFECSDRN